MEDLKIDVNLVNEILKPVLIILFLSAVISIKIKRINLFETYLSMFKFIFYLILAILTYLLNVKIVDEEVIVNFAKPKKLSIGQSLLILLSLLEAMSNFVTMFRMPKSESHLVRRDNFSEYKIDQINRRSEIHQRIGHLERELEIVKSKSSRNKIFKKKKKRGKRKKG